MQGSIRADIKAKIAFNSLPDSHKNEDSEDDDEKYFQFPTGFSRKEFRLVVDNRGEILSIPYRILTKHLAVHS